MARPQPASATTAPDGVFTLHLLRQPRLQGPGGEVLALSRKDAALLAVLALDGTAARDILAAQLWPAVDTARARASLRQRRFRLARAAGQALVEGEEALRLATSVVPVGQDPDHLLAADAHALDGELLDGLVFADCPDFERWLGLARERWQVQRNQALARVAGRLEAESRLVQALAIAQRLAQDEPLSDHAHRRLMRLHHLRGDLGAALDVYRRFAQQLDRELGELPDDETASLAAQLRQGQDLPRASAPLPASLQRPPRLVGREDAWQVLQRAWDAGVSVLVEGAPGMGKTRLLNDFLHAQGASLRVGAHPGDADRPYALLARLLAALWFEPGAPWPTGPAALPAWARRELAALLPELGDAPPRLDPLRLTRATLAALQPPPGTTALRALALDDVQQADQASLELLPVLAAAKPDSGVAGDQALRRPPCWWLAVRRGEQPPPLANWMAASDAPRVLVLAPLDLAALQQLQHEVSPGPPAIDARQLLRYTGGSPLFVLETLRSLYELRARETSSTTAPSSAAPVALTKPASPVAGAAHLGAELGITTHNGSDSAVLAQLALPAGAAGVVQGRLQRLPDTARQLAAAVAVLHGPVSLDDAACLLGGDPGLLLHAFQQLQAAHWLDEQGRMHDLVRQAVWAQQPEAVRRWLHAQAAARLATLAAPAQDQARHWLQAARPDLAAPLWQQAALAVRRSARPLEETELWDQAIAAFEAAGQPQAAFAAWRNSIEPRLFSQGPKATLPLTAALLQRAADDSQRLDALIAHAEVQVLLTDAAQVRPLVEQASRLARRLGDAASEVRAGLQLASLLAQQDGCVEALSILDTLAPLLAAAPAERYAWTATRSFVLHRSGRFAACAEMLKQAGALAQARQDLMEVCTTRSNMASMLVSLGRFERALLVIESALAVREQLGPATGVHHANVDLNHGYVLAGLGRLHDALAAMERARDAFSACDPGGTWPTIAGNALAAAELTRAERARTHTTSAGTADWTPADHARDTAEITAATAAAAARLVAPGPQVPPFIVARYHLLQARIARARGQDEQPALQRAEAALGPQGDLMQRLSVQAERLAGLPETAAEQAALGLAALQTQLDAAEQHAQAARLGWLAVERWLQARQPAAAGALARALLRPRAPRPIDLLPSTVWTLAERAWREAGDSTAARRARQRQRAAQLLEQADEGCPVSAR